MVPTIGIIISENFSSKVQLKVFSLRLNERTNTGTDPQDKSISSCDRATSFFAAKATDSEDFRSMACSIALLDFADAT